jgi:hypothetical protein
MDWALGLAGNREICRDCPTSKVRIQRVWTSYLCLRPLIEEGNAFEADVVKGVEDAGDADDGEVHTHEVPQDDVPGEYLDKRQ